jgi:hypothetical protein
MFFQGVTIDKYIIKEHKGTLASGFKVLFMAPWKEFGALVSPKAMMVNANCPQ